MTIEKFIKDNYSNHFINDTTAEIIAVEFAKLHVQACKEEIVKNAKLKYQDFGDGDLEGIDENSIRNTYPESNIK